MLYQYKEITVLRLKDYVPEGLTLDEHLDRIELEQLPITIAYDRNNPYDRNAKNATLPDGSIIGMVNADSHRYLKRLLERNAGHTCVGKFAEVVRREGHTPVVVYKVLINLEDVERLRPGQDWESWDIELPGVVWFRELDAVQRLSAMLMDDFLTGEDKPYYESLIRRLEEASLYDMSIETTERYDDLCFLLESNSSPKTKRYKNLLQHASTVRRTDRQRQGFIRTWWPEAVGSAESDRLWMSYLSSLRCNNRIGDGGELGQQVIKEELDRIDDRLKLLPYGLYEKVGRPADLFSAMFYTRINRDRQQKLLSALILRERLGKLMDTKETKVTNMYVAGSVSIGDNAQVNDVVEKGGKKIVMLAK